MAEEKIKPKGTAAAVVEKPSAEQMLIAKAQGTPAVVTDQDLSEVVDKETLGDDRGRVTHTKPGRVAVYKPTPYGYKRREIPATGLPQALKNGFLPNCPDCGGECDSGPNDCPKRPKRMYRRCMVPSCGHKVYDYQPDEIDLALGEDQESKEDEAMIKDDAYMESTPELRTKAMMDKHMWGRQSTVAAAAGIKDPRPVMVKT